LSIGTAIYTDPSLTTPLPLSFSCGGPAGWLCSKTIKSTNLISVRKKIKTGNGGIITAIDNC
jgi:hypothetical protein